MKQPIQYMRALVVEDDAATAIEYGLLAALIASVIITTVTTLGSTVVGLYASVESKLP